MAREITTAEYRALAELRYRLRLFLKEGDFTAREAGLEPQQYLLLLALRGLPEGKEATIQTLADRLALEHHSAVELVDRLAARGYVQRKRSRVDRRRVLVVLSPRGAKRLGQVASQRISELRSTGAALVNALEALLEGHRNKKLASRKQMSSQKIKLSPAKKAKK